MPSIEELLAELAQAPPSAFTEARNALVARLAKLGQSDATARIKALRRPTAALWVVNRLARVEQDSIGRLIAAADRMRAAQVGRGAGSDAFATASVDHRTALAHLSERAGALLKEAGLGDFAELQLPGRNGGQGRD